MHLIQGWFAPSDEGVEDEIYESAAMAWFAGTRSRQDYASQ